MSASSPEDHAQRKKRVGKACDMCRIKKTRCDGKMPCSRCTSDNKICAFTDKKRNKERVHPSGYIEMLETRVDLLSKSLMKVLTVAEPHLPFMAEIKARQITKSSTSIADKDPGHFSDMSVPINDVISYLISDLGLLRDVPQKVDETVQSAVYLEPLESLLPTLPKEDTSNHHQGSFSNHDLRPTSAPDIDSASLGAQELNDLKDTSLNFPNFEPDHRESRSINEDSSNPYNSVESLEALSALLKLTSRDLLFSHYGNKHSTSSLSLSTLASANREEHESRHTNKRLNTTKRSHSPFSVRKVNSGHIQKPQKPVISPPLYAAEVLSEIDKELQLGQISGFIPSFHDKPSSDKIREPSSISDYQGLGTDFYEDLLFSEPPSLAITDTVGSFSSTDIFGAGNPFMGSL